jgi:hypothetical protein
VRGDGYHAAEAESGDGGAVAAESAGWKLRPGGHCDCWICVDDGIENSAIMGAGCGFILRTSWRGLRGRTEIIAVNSSAALSPTRLTYGREDLLACGSSVRSHAYNMEIGDRPAINPAHFINQYLGTYLALRKPKDTVTKDKRDNENKLNKKN